MGVNELFKEFKSKNLIKLLDQADLILIDGCIYWELVLPKESDYPNEQPGSLKTDPDFRKTQCGTFLKHIFGNLIKLELEAIEHARGPCEIQIVFDNMVARSWLKFSRCIQRVKNRDVMKAKKLRFHPTMAELEQAWADLGLDVGSETQVKFVEAPGETDDYIKTICDKVSNPRSRNILVEDLFESSNSISAECSRVSIYSADSDFVSFFPFKSQISIFHGDLWNKNFQVTRLLNFEPVDSPFWTIANNEPPEFKLALFKTYVVSRGRNDFMTCSLQPPRKDIDWQDFASFAKLGNLKEDTGVTVFFNFLYYLHLDSNINPLKIKQTVGNALRLFVADPEAGETWTFIELNSATASTSKVISNIESLKSFLEARIQLLGDLKTREKIELQFKQLCTPATTTNINISLALAEWYAYFDIKHQSTLTTSKPAKKRAIDQTKWSVFQELNETIYKALVLFYLGLFKVWFIVQKRSETYTAFDMFLKRLYETICTGNNMPAICSNIKARDFFYKILNQ